MFWNPAAITQFNGKTIEQIATGILPHASHSFTTASEAALGNAGNSGMNALVPAGYASWQLNDRFWLGMSVNAPFGLGVHFPQVWAGARGGSGQSAKIETYNFAPTAAYKINDWISVAIGLQAQYLRAEYDAYVNTVPTLISTLKGAGWGFGWTAGVTLTPLPKTQIGIGYRSAIDQKVNGTLDQPAAWLAGGGSQGSVNLVLNLPDVVTVGLRQGIGDRFTLLAGLEWTNWSRIGTTNVYLPNGSPALLRAGTPFKFPFEYRDGWFYSLGGEYKLDPAWTVRAGIAYERTPITDDVRTVRIPDNDRMWYSVGASYKPASLRGLTFDAGYSFISFKNAPVCMGPAALGGCPGNPWSGSQSYVGSVSSYTNIISVGVRYQWDDAAPAPIKQRYAN
jgi:long-chain fatty acid transport protein